MYVGDGFGHFRHHFEPFTARCQQHNCHHYAVVTTDRSNLKTQPETRNHGSQSGLGPTFEFKMSRYKGNYQYIYR